MKGTTLSNLIMSYQKQVISIVSKTGSVTKEPLLTLIAKNSKMCRPRGKAFLRIVRNRNSRNY